MTVRAKFKVSRLESSMANMPTGEKDVNGRDVYGPVEVRTICMYPVYGNGDPNHENTKFWKASPSGELKLGTINPEAWGAFRLDGEYYLDFTPVPK